MNKKTEIIGIRTDKETFDNLKSIADREERSMSQIVCFALRDYLKSDSVKLSKQPEKQFDPHSEQSGSVFRKHHQSP